MLQIAKATNMSTHPGSGQRQKKAIAKAFLVQLDNPSILTLGSLSRFLDESKACKKLA